VNCDKCKCKIKYKIQNTVLYSRLRDCTVRHDVSYTVLYSSTTVPGTVATVPGYSIQYDIYNI
jgi:hypothetical protein